MTRIIKDIFTGIRETVNFVVTGQRDGLENFRVGKGVIRHDRKSFPWFIFYTEEFAKCTSRENMTEIFAKFCLGIRMHIIQKSLLVKFPSSFCRHVFLVLLAIHCHKCELTWNVKFHEVEHVYRTRVPTTDELLFASRTIAEAVFFFVPTIIYHFELLINCFVAFHNNEV